VSLSFYPTADPNGTVTLVCNLHVQRKGAIFFCDIINVVSELGGSHGFAGWISHLFTGNAGDYFDYRSRIWAAADNQTGAQPHWVNFSKFALFYTRESGNWRT
jgi:hypothetical protein